MRRLRYLALISCVILPMTAFAQEPPSEDEDAGSVHLNIKAAANKNNSKIIRSHFDLSVYHFIPQGVLVQEQPERSRILFQTRGHIPAGYAERKGQAIIYYDSQGKAVRVQRLTMAEMDRIERR